MKLLYMGRKNYGAQMLEWSHGLGFDIVGVVIGSSSAYVPVLNMALSLGLKTISEEEAYNLIESGTLEMDVIVSYLYENKIKEPMISSPKYGCINFHPAILPNWRGVGGYNIAILNRLDQWGATAHYIDSCIDTGPIIKVMKFDFDHEVETCYSLEKRTQKIQMDLYRNVMKEVLEKGKLESCKQSLEEGIYISRFQLEEMKKVNFNDDIDLFIRAFWFPPYTGAYLEKDGKKYTLVNEEILTQIASKYANNEGE